MLIKKIEIDVLIMYDCKNVSSSFESYVPSKQKTEG